MPKAMTAITLLAVLVSCICSGLSIVQIRDLKNSIADHKRLTREVSDGKQSATTSIAGVWIPDITTTKRFQRNNYVPANFELYIGADGWILLRPSDPSRSRPEHECFRWTTQKDGKFKVSIASDQSTKLDPEILNFLSEFELSIRLHDGKNLIVLVSPVREAKKDTFLDWLHEEAAGSYVLNRK